MSAFVLATWLLLNQTVALGHVLLGAVLGVVVAQAFTRLDPPPLRVRNHHLIPVLAAVVLYDIVRSNLALLRIILVGRKRPVRSGFVRIPMQLTDHYGLAILACIITSTPGTIWMSYQADRSILLIHVFDLVDEETWILTIKSRYETPLREIFE
jgi:multicomponent K+:H+ antiporter subunit E